MTFARTFGGGPGRSGLPAVGRTRLLGLGSAAAAALLFCAAAFAQTAPSPPPATAGAQPACLQCHGPYDKLIEATSGYYMPSGETTSPHRYVPHKSKAVPDCRNCHQPHPLPVTAKPALPPPSTDWCYTCHHKGALECGTCHQ